MSTTTEQLSMPSRIGQGRLAFRHWRWHRPFWAGTLTLAAGFPIAYFPYANMQLGELTIRMSTTAGAGSLVIGVLLMVLGLTMWFQPQSRVFAGVAAILLSLVSLVVSNFGGFLIGFLLGLFGGAMSVSWMPGTTGVPDEDQQPEKSPYGTLARAIARPVPPAVTTPGTGSALAGFASTTRERERAVDEAERGKGTHRAE